MTQRLKILFLCSWYPSKEHSTLGNFVQRHAIAVGMLHDVTVLYGIESNTPEIKIEKNGNIEEHLIYFKKRLPLLSYKKALKKYFFQLNAERGFDLVHIHVAYPAVSLLSVIKQSTVITEHFSGYHKNTGFKWGFMRERITRKGLNQSKYILPVSDHLGKAIKEFRVQNNFQKVSNVVDANLFSPDKSKNEKFTFLHVSSLEERSKNITGILKAFKQLEDLDQDFILEIGGDGDQDILKTKISDSGLSLSKIRTFGESNSEEIAAKMKRSHALVMFSHFENQPCTILESLCCGTPIISSDVGGIPEEINPQNGILVQKGDIDSFVQALLQMIKNHHQYDTLKISNEAKSKYSYSAVAEQVSKVYFNVLSKGS